MIYKVEQYNIKSRKGQNWAPYVKIKYHYILIIKNKLEIPLTIF